MKERCLTCGRLVSPRIEYESVYGYRKIIKICPACGKVYDIEEDEDLEEDYRDDD